VVRSPKYRIDEADHRVVVYWPSAVARIACYISTHPQNGIDADFIVTVVEFGFAVLA
jgi:hypothetical protein